MSEESVVVPDKGYIGGTEVRAGDLIFYTPSKMAFRIVKRWSFEWVWRKALEALR